MKNLDIVEKRIKRERRAKREGREIKEEMGGGGRSRCSKSTQKPKKIYFKIIRKIQALFECEHSDLPDS